MGTNNVRNRCPECGGQVIYYDVHYVYGLDTCVDCGWSKRVYINEEEDEEALALMEDMI